MYFEDDLEIPPLVPIKNYQKQANRQTIETPSTLRNQELLQVFAKEFDKMHPEKEEAKPDKIVRPALTPEGMDDIEKKFSNLQEKTSKEGGERAGTTLGSRKEKELQKAKFMVGEMMKKIDAKNISEELYPVTNETILGMIGKMEREIEELKVEAEKKENSLVTNPNNQLLRRELENLKTSIDRCVTIKELYNQKINLRNKVSVLERSLISLKEENENLRIQTHQDEEAVALHAQGQPCQKEKQLKEELSRCRADLKKVTDIKEQLENNVADIVHSFKRLYEEADMARTIVTSRLSQLQKQTKHFDSDSASSEKASLSNAEERPSKPTSQNRDTSNLEVRVVGRAERREERDKEKEKGKLSLAEQIKKMRGTQGSFSKQQPKK